jgi:hypothetical protein
MVLSYKSNFPTDWTEEKILECVDEIATDPKIPWKQITGLTDLITRPYKYLVDGVWEGKRIRIIIEPDGRGILLAYPLD